MIEHGDGWLFVGKDGRVYLGAFDAGAGAWQVMRVEIGFGDLVYDGVTPMDEDE